MNLESVERAEKSQWSCLGNVGMVSRKTNLESCFFRQGKSVSNMREGSTVLDAFVGAVRHCPDPTSGMKSYFPSCCE